MSTQALTKDEITDHIQNDTMPFPVVMKLQVPLNFSGDTTIDELNFKNKLGTTDILDMPVQNLTLRNFLGPMGKMTGQSQGIIRNLDPMDAYTGMAVINYFLTNSPATGN